MKSTISFVSILIYISLLTKYLLTIIITKEFGFENFSYYQVIINYGSLLAVLFNGGFGLLALQSFSGNKIYHLKYEISLVYLYLGIVSGFILFLIVIIYVNNNFNNLFFFIIILTGICASYNKVIAQSLIGLKKQIISVVVGDLSMPIISLLLIYMATFTIDQFIFIRNILIYTASLISFIIIFYSSRNFLKLKLIRKIRLSRPINYHYYKILIKNMSINFIRMLNDRLDILVSPLLLTPFEFGTYMFVRTFLSVLGIPFSVATKMYSPEVLSLIGLNRNIDKERKFKNLNKLILILLVVLSLIIWLQFKNINAIFGIDISFSYNFMFFFMFGYIVEVVFGQNLALLTFGNLRKESILCLSIVFVFSIILTPILIFFFKVTGAAISFAITTMFKNLILDYFCRKKLASSPSIFA